MTFVPFVPMAFAGLAKKVDRANEVYATEDYDNAYKQYKEILKKEKDILMLNYNLGNVHYQKKEYDLAIQEYLKALLDDDEVFKHKVRYNLASAMFYHGLSLEKDNVEDAIKFLTGALDQYDEVLENNEDPKIQRNYPIIENEIKRLQQEQHEQQKSCDNPQDSKDKDSQKQEDKNQSQEDNKSSQKQQNQKGQEGKGNQEDKQDEKDPDNQDNKEKESSEEQGEDQNQNNSGKKEKNDNNGDDKDKGDVDQDSEDANDEGSDGEESSKSDPSMGENKDNEVQSGDKMDLRALNFQEAKMLLQDYEQNKEPKGLLRFPPRRKNRNISYRDW